MTNDHDQLEAKYDKAIYGVYDAKAEEFIGRFLSVHRHEATAMRDFYELCMDPNTPVHRHPDDFSLIRLAYLDDRNKVVWPEAHQVTTARRVLDLVEANADAKGAK